MTEGIIARRYLISGRVQGVGFRWFAKRAADSAGVTGYVRNLRDGRVEAVAVGSPARVAGFRQAISKGPGYSVVTGIDEVKLPPDTEFSDFDITY
jgi:acylphosphatase